VDSRFPHLPDGRPPGKQSRSQRTSHGWFQALLLLLAAFFVGLALYGASDPGESPAWVYLAAFLPMALSCVGGVWYIRRKGRRRVARHFSVGVRTPEVARGGEVEAELRISDASAVKGELQVGLVLLERYDHEEVTHHNNGTSRQRVTREHAMYESWERAQAGQPLQRFRFAVPASRPYSYEGACLSFAWAVVAREQRPARVDPRCDAPFWVTP
jgi:hypothetical protein